MPTSLLPQFPLNVSSTAWTGFFLGLKVGRHRHILETCSSTCKYMRCARQKSTQKRKLHCITPTVHHAQEKQQIPHHDVRAKYIAASFASLPIPPDIARDKALNVRPLNVVVIVIGDDLEIRLALVTTLQNTTHTVPWPRVHADKNHASHTATITAPFAGKLTWALSTSMPTGADITTAVLFKSRSPFAGIGPFEVCMPLFAFVNALFASATTQQLIAARFANAFPLMFDKDISA